MGKNKAWTALAKANGRFKPLNFSGKMKNKEELEA